MAQSVTAHINDGCVFHHLHCLDLISQSVGLHPGRTAASTVRPCIYRRDGSPTRLYRIEMGL